MRKDGAANFKDEALNRGQGKEYGGGGFGIGE